MESEDGLPPGNLENHRQFIGSGWRKSTHKWGRPRHRLLGTVPRAPSFVANSGCRMLKRDAHGRRVAEKDGAGADVNIDSGPGEA
jgi:hypothetical protein